MIKKKYYKTNIIFIIVFIIFLISFSSIKSWFNHSVSKDENVMNTPNSFLYSIDKTANSFTGFFSGIKKYFVSRRSLEVEIEYLKSQIQKEQYGSLVDSSTTSTNNVVLKNGPIIAKKIFSDFTSIYDTVLLNKGFLNGVEKGDMVFIYPNKLIGQIESINSNTSLMSLYSRNKNKIEAVLKASRDDSVLSRPQTGVGSTSTSTFIDNSSSTLSFSSSTIFNSNNDIRISATSRNIIIDIYGNGSGDFFVSLPDNIKVSTGTVIYLASDESKALGEVVKVENEEASFYQKIFIRGYYNTRINNDYYIVHK